MSLIVPIDRENFPIIPTDLTTPPRLKVSRYALEVTMWTLTSLCFFFVIFRVWIRTRFLGKLLSEDYMVLAAWTMLLTNTAIVQDRIANFFGFYAALHEKVPPVQQIAEELNLFQDYFVSLSVIYVTCLWLIKLSFMVFFYKLSPKNNKFRIYWWIVLGINVATYVFSAAIYNFQCVSTTTKMALVNCATSGPIRDTWDNLFIKAVLDVFTDLLILTMPFIILWKAEIPMRQKIALLAVLSVSVVKMLTSVVRTVVLNSRKKSFDMSWLLVFCQAEMAIAVFIACVASFRQLFVIGERKCREKEGTLSSDCRFSRWSKFSHFGVGPHKFSFGGSSSDKDSILYDDRKYSTQSPSVESGRLESPQGVYVARHFHVSSEVRWDIESVR